VEGATADEIPVMRNCLMNHGQALVARLRPKFEEDRADGQGVLPHASILAAFDPTHRWSRSKSELVATRLVNASVDSIGAWTRNLRPAQHHLLQPLRQILLEKERSLDERLIAADVLMAYAPSADQDAARHIVDVLVEVANAEQFQRIVESLKKVPPAIDVVNAKLASLDEAARGKHGDEREAVGEKQMYVVAAILKLGAPAAIWERFRHSQDPTLRSLLIENLAALGIEPALLVSRLEVETDVTVRRALVLALAEYDRAQLMDVDLAKVAADLQRWTEHQDAGLHAAADWTRRRWAQKRIVEPVNGQAQRDLQSGLRDRRTSPYPTWYRTPEGHEMIVVNGPLEFQMGSPPSEQYREGGAQGDFERQHTERIPRCFAIATKETTVSQFLAAWKDLKLQREFRGDEPTLRWLLFWPTFANQPRAPLDDFPYSREKAPSADCPINNVDWYLAAAYCNWLSKQEGIPREQWCYMDVPFQHGMTLPPDHLRRAGYRLPTEAEWEYVCRAGATTSRFHGEGLKLLTKFAWCTSNSSWRSRPVGQLKPNDFGLFDTLGNIEEWCQGNAWKYTAQPHDDVEQRELRVLSNELRSHRGGGFEYDPRNIRSAARDRSDPDYPYFQLGFRVARTLPN
jgi:formylglycine-generating enzyme required for sulfatase activity